MPVALRRLLLLRHAKSSWDEPGLTDHQRPLAPRGRRAARDVGLFIRSQGLLPQRIIASDSCRTRQTAEIVFADPAQRPPIAWLSALYLASARQILALIGQQEDEAASLLVLGHEPGMGVLANELAAFGDDGERAAMAAKFPTAALAVIAFRAERWRHIAAGEGQLIRFVRPRDLAAP